MSYPEGAFQPTSHDEATRAMFPAGPPELNDSPLAAAHIWYRSIVGRDFARARSVSWDPSDDVSRLGQLMDGYVLAQAIEIAAERSDVAFAKLFPSPGFSGYSMQDDLQAPGAFWLTLVERHGRWFAWSLTESPSRPRAVDAPSA